MTVPLRCVVDTNVAATAGQLNPDASAAAVAVCAEALQAVMREGHVFLDAGQEILGEYRNVLKASPPTPGSIFLKWVLQNEWIAEKVTRVRITSKAADPSDFKELPKPLQGVSYDPSDRKFLAVAVAAAEHPQILLALDHKWLAWPSSLARHGVTIHFLCPAEIEAIRARKAKKK